MQQLLLELAPPPPPTLDNFSLGKRRGAEGAAGGSRGGERFVFLWGPGGSGKTHLLRAFAGTRRAAAYMRASNADWSRASGLELAAVDDVASLDDSGRRLFDLCNRLRLSGGALAASGEAPPARLALRADLRSRLASGIVLQLHPLSDEDKGRSSLRACRGARNRARRGADPLPPHALRSRHGHADRGARRRGQVFAAAQAPDHAASVERSAELARRGQRQALTQRTGIFGTCALRPRQHAALGGQRLRVGAVPGRARRASSAPNTRRRRPLSPPVQGGQARHPRVFSNSSSPRSRTPRERSSTSGTANSCGPGLRPSSARRERSWCGGTSATIISARSSPPQRLHRGADRARLRVDQLLATELEVKDGRFTGKPSGTPCFRQGKVTRLAEWLGDQGARSRRFPTAGSTADSQNDRRCSSA